MIRPSLSRFTATIASAAAASAVWPRGREVSTPQWLIMMTAPVAPFPAQPPQEPPLQQLGVEPVGLGPAMFTRYGDTRGMDHVSLDATRLKPARQPEAIATGFEGHDRWQHDVWHRIVEAALNGCPDRPNLSDS
jgi:hypothetical protein